MSKNDLVLLNTLLGDWAKAAPNGLNEAEQFELFAMEQLLKSEDLSTDELLDGLVGGGNDGGIDGFYTFLNGDLLDEDTDLSDVKREVVFDVYAAQAKRTESFDEGVFDKFRGTLSDLFDLGKDDGELLETYSPRLVERAAIFRETLKKLAGQHPKVSVVVAVATKGSTANINAKVAAKAKKVVRICNDAFAGGSADVLYMGARELLEAARKSPTPTLSLPFSESVSAGTSYVVLVNLRDYYGFLTSEQGALRRYIFESNVRDYQGNVEVNKEIRHALELADVPEFWWLNNGVTIIASKATITGKVIALSDPQIVNGLQTSVQIHEFLTSRTGAPEARSVLCRIVVTDDDVLRDKIIKATNSQTSVPAASLKATDKVQRDIESYFMANKWYYDRRKNFYKNARRPAEKIVSIPYLAQALMAIGLSRPDDSRARPTTLIKSTEDYSAMFGESVDLAVFLWAAQVMKKVDAFLRGKNAPGSADEQRELRFHVATWVTAREAGKPIRHPSQLRPYTGALPSDTKIKHAVEELIALLAKYPARKRRPLDRIAKSRDFVDYLFAEKFGAALKPSSSRASTPAKGVVVAVTATKSTAASAQSQKSCTARTGAAKETAKTVRAIAVPAVARRKSRR